MLLVRGEVLVIGKTLKYVGALIALGTILINIFIDNFTITTFIIIVCEILIVLGYLLNKKHI
jgi:hypothetical protein